MQSWPLRFISESTDMVKLRDLVSRQASDAVDTSNTAEDADSQDQDFLDAASPETRSEVSQWYDAQSEAPGSSASSQLDPNEDGLPPVQNGTTTPPRKPSGLWTDWQAQFTQEKKQRLAADEVVRELRQQREHMNAELFGLRTENAALKDENRSLKQDNAMLQETVQQHQADEEASASAASFTTRLFARIIAEQVVAAQHKEEVERLQKRYSNLQSMTARMQEQRRTEELDEQERTSTWSYHFRQCARYAGCVALGAGSILALIRICEGQEGLRALRPQQ